MKPIILVIVMVACTMYLLLHNTDSKKEVTKSGTAIHKIKTAAGNKSLQSLKEEVLFKCPW